MFNHLKIYELKRRLYEFIGSDLVGSGPGSRSFSSGNLQSINPITSSGPIFASIFSYYETKSVQELGKILNKLLEINATYKIRLNCYSKFL